MSPTKCCRLCGGEFPATSEYFYRRSASRDGLFARCKPCVNQKSNAWYQANRERKLETCRRYQEANRERYAEWTKRWYQANRKRKAETNRRWLEANRDKHREAVHRNYVSNRVARLEQIKRYRLAHQAQYLDYSRRRRARKLSAAGSHTVQDVQRQYSSQKGRCWWCGCELNGVYEVDHRIPLSRGGSDAPENLVASCTACNRSKSDKLPHEWNGRLL